jgi:N-methylhydantoinase A
MRLDAEAAHDGIGAQIAEPLGLDATAAAWAIHELVNTSMAAAARSASVERGVDPRRAALVAFGGAGPVHASRLAAGLGIGRVIVPVRAGVASAFGLLAGDVKFDAVRTHRLPLIVESLEHANRDYAELEKSLLEMVVDAVGAERAATCRFARTADIRYAGQGYELRVALLDRPLDERDVPGLASAFEHEYRAVYGRSAGSDRVEIVNWRLEARLASGAETVPAVALEDGEALKGSMDVYFPEAGGFVSCPVYDRCRLAPGRVLPGPAVVEERESTTVVLPSQRLEVHAQGHLVLTADGA